MMKSIIDIIIIIIMILLGTSFLISSIRIAILVLNYLREQTLNFFK